MAIGSHSKPPRKRISRFFQQVNNDPEFREGLLFRHPQNKSDVESWLEDRVEADDTVFLLICVDDEPIGQVNLFRIHPPNSAMLAYWLLPEYHGDGYATEAAALILDHAFRDLGLHRVLAWTIGYNDASQNLLKRLGFTHEGTYREHVFKNGEFQDTEHYGLLVSEWDGYERVWTSAKEESQ